MIYLIKDYYSEGEFKVRKGFSEDTKKWHWCVIKNNVDIGHEKNLKTAVWVCKNYYPF